MNALPETITGKEEFESKFYLENVSHIIDLSIKRKSNTTFYLEKCHTKVLTEASNENEK